MKSGNGKALPGEEAVNYNLLHEKWIPVLWRRGNTTRVGIMEALTRAGEICQIAASNPMDRVAILRFLLALLYWCKGNPPDSRLPADSFPKEWFTKLEENKDCFNLLGEGKRFYQDPAVQRPGPATRLIQEIPAGNNFWHFRHSTDKESGLCPACCAMGLLRLPLFSVSGLSGPGEPNMMAGINGVPPIYIVPWRMTLFETLLANWVSCADIGEPSWASPAASPIPSDQIPLLTGLTLLPRRVWLHDPHDGAAACVNCGEITRPIATCGFQTAGKKENDNWIDPHVLYLDTTPRRALRAQDATEANFRMDRPWPDLLARMIETRKEGTLLVVGFATNKAKNVDVWERIVELQATASAAEATVRGIRKWKAQGDLLEKETCLEMSKVRKCKAQGDLLEKETCLERSKVLCSTALAAIRPHVEASVSGKIGELLGGGEKAWEEAAREYSPLMGAVAQSLSPGYTTAALEGRKRIESVRPCVRMKAERARKPGPTNGGDK
jgi:CRISPR type I-E-associated protein CasA/Cse1